MTNQSKRPKNLILQQVRGLSASPCPLAGKGSTCSLTLTINGSLIPDQGLHTGPVLCEQGNPNQCYQPNAANSLNINKGEVPPDTATLSINPSVVNIETGETSSTVTIKNESNTVTAEMLAFTSTNVSLLNNTCTIPLPPQNTCSFQVESTVVGQHAVTAQGINTNVVSLTVNVSAVPLVNISIDGPVQQNRIIGVNPAASLSLTIRNDDASNAANDITVSNHNACPNLTVDDSDCISVAPGDACILELNSATPYVPCEITISGSNTANSPTTLIAFQTGGGLVYAIDGATLKVVADSDEGNLPWDSSDACVFFLNCTDIPAAEDPNDGPNNTFAIIMALTGEPGVTDTNFAAGACNEKDGGVEGWYLPARNELTTVHGALCSNFATPCNFGGFTSAFYWSSSQLTIDDAQGIVFPSGIFSGGGKGADNSVRCVRDFF
ncbi:MULTISPECIES: DUF1566 domain-containing protein [unclassified Legionella]|uniref:DUF1566 domain-containing protein n=1 Tax=unclassified Legionella TaxID=2622702 RepID=UPI0013EF7448|nr:MULTISPECIES: DUF1566 domain-containing protein [unclassified Legionella]MDI9818192.1 DUF1566 domain-containing protein [Legionella sp. PL877]